MYLNRGDYDRGVNTFSPEGRLFQVEYALEAIKLGTTAIGFKTNEGVVLVAERRLTSPLLEPESINKIIELDSHIGCAMSGLTPDSNIIIDYARVEAQNHRFVYNEAMRAESLAQAICDLALTFGEHGKEKSLSRPFGVALLIAAYDKTGPHLYIYSLNLMDRFCADPSGTYFEYDAKSIGSGSENAQIEIKEQYSKTMSLEQAVECALKILKQVMEDKITSKNIQVAIVNEEGYKLMKEEDINRYISE